MRDERDERDADREDLGRDDPRERRDREDYGLADFSYDYRYDPDRRAGYRVQELGRRREDFGQADYSEDYVYDPDRVRAYRRFSDAERDPESDERIYGRGMGYSEYRRGAPPRYADARDGREDIDVGEHGRSWMDRAGDFFAGRGSAEGAHRRRGPSDRVLWAVIVERLEDQRGLDLRDLEVLVEDGEVTLNGTVRRKDDKRRIEDIADVEGVRNVQNNLRVRERRWF
jgi:hypothetical protein